MKGRRHLRRLRRESSAILKRGKPAETKFVIFAQGRTGTWLLYNLLNQHPKVTCNKEILMWPVRSPRHYLEQRSRGATVYGCHVQVNQLLNTQKVPPAAFLGWLVANGWHILYVRRQNIVRQSISTMIARQRREWVTTKANRLASEKFTINGPDLMRWLGRRHAHLEIERQALTGLPFLPLVYEADLQQAVQQQATLNRVFAYLGLDSHPVKANVKKLASRNLAALVENYSEIVHLLTNTHYEKYLEMD